MVRLKRVYEAPRAEDGFRVLVDRLWPRGLSKPKARVNLWLKEVAPSDSLRRWFAHDPKKWPQFQRRYREELKKAPAALEALRSLKQKENPLTLLYAAQDPVRNNAVVLAELLRRSG